MRQWLSGIPVLLLLLVLATAVAGWFGLRAVEKQMKAEISNRLASELKASVVSLEIWLAEKRASAAAWAGEEQVRRSAILLATPRNDAERAGGAEVAAGLPSILSPVCGSYKYAGYALLG